MRTRLFLIVALCTVGAIVPAVGATASVRNQVELLLADPAVESTAPEVGNARARAKAMLAEADAARSSKEEDANSAAAVLDETALEWAQLTKELIELAKLQAEADEAERRQLDLDGQLKREKAHLEETEARRGRALAALKKLGESTELQAPAASLPNGASQ